MVSVKETVIFVWSGMRQQWKKIKVQCEWMQLAAA